MIERHYEDEALIALMESSRATTDAHLPSCMPCSTKADSFRTIAGALRDRHVWDTREVRTDARPSTIATLRAFADRMTDEDTRAEQILTELLAGAREEWMPRLEQHPEWRTAGVVRKLVAAAPRAIDIMPPDAVAIATLATDIAEHLEASAYPSDTVARLCGAAWRERAYALYYTSRFTEADAAIRVSQEHFERCVVNEYELARLGIVRALVQQDFDDFVGAAKTAANSAAVFARHEDVERTASARLAEVHVLYRLGQFDRAESVLLELDAYLSETSFVETHARVLGNLGYCSYRLGKLEAAIHYYDIATTILDELGIETEALRNRWTVTTMLAETGRFAAASDRLLALSSDLERLGMSCEAACNGLYVAELLLAANKYDQVEQICRNSIEIFKRAGLGYTARALTALAYIQEAARHRTANPKLVRSVREYIRQLPSQPNLLFAPPPP